MELWRLMQSKLVVYLLLFNFVLLTLVPINLLADDVWWDDDWSFRQEIIIPIDTSTELAKFQPVDVFTEFDNSCWAKNENEHSVRVIFQDGGNLKELESQIYNLDYSDDTRIISCGLVFLIPEEASGRGQYYIYYDDSRKSAPDYVDHVGVEEAYYLYEPISGYPLESRFFKIVEDGYVVYAVAQEGEVMGYRTSQHVTKLKEKTTEVLPKNGELFAAFDFRYYFGQDMFDYSASSHRLVSKELLVDGNLMVEFGIVSRSDRDDIQTTATYKYYYNPTQNNRIHAHVKHEALSECKVDHDLNTDGTFAILQCGGIKSTSIKDLNFGEILPYLHVYNEQETVTEYPLDPDPEYVPDDLDIRVLSNGDDVDLGTRAWASYDEGESGVSHSIIFGSNSVVASGEDERDGIQINVYEMDYPHLPGLESNSASLQFGRNSFESGGVQDLSIPEDFVVEFDAEFFSSQTGGYEIIQEEADIFQSLVELKPSSRDDFAEDEEETDKYALTVFVHLAPSLPMGSGLSALTGRNVSYVGAELYKEDKFIGSGTAGRLQMRPLPDFSEATMIQQIIATFFAFDWKNFSFFKKISFQNLEPGTYIVKIYKENPVFGKERKFVGFTVVDVQDNTKARVFCRSEGSVQISVVDQDGEGVQDAEVVLQKNEVVIAKSITDDSGQASIKAPCSIRDSYNLKILYNGFIVNEEPVKLRYVRKLVPVKKSIDIERYDFRLEILDTWGLSPEFELNPILVSEEMDEPTDILVEKLTASNYVFTNLIPANYQLSLKYKSFSVEKTVEIDSEGAISLVFPAEYTIKINTLDSRGITVEDARIIVSRGGNKVEERSNETSLIFSLPPGIYSVNVYDQEDLIGSRKINVLGERSFDLITTLEPQFPLIVTVFAIVFVLLALVYTYMKKDVMYFLKIFSVSLAIVAIVSPWWMLYGSTSQVETSTKMFLTPLELVTTTVTPDVISGELASLPELFVDVVSLIPILTAIGCLLILSSIFFKRYNKKRLYFLSLIFAIIALIGSVLIFSVGMSELAGVGVGGFIGDGNLDVTIPGEETFATIFCSWGPSVGFYLYVISVVILVIIIVFNIRKMSSKKE